MALAVARVAALAAVLAAAVPQAHGSHCPCENAALCKPINVGPRKEVFAFHPHAQEGDTRFKQYDWSQLTTVATYGDQVPADLLCYAHSKNARVVHKTAFPQDQLTNETAVDQWIDENIKLVQASFADGINLDIEGDTNGTELLTAFTKKLAGRLHAAIPGSQLSFDSSIYPAGQPGYNWTEIGNAVDFLFIMAYDMCWNADWAEPNSPLGGIDQGIQQYFVNISLPPEKLVLGLPWYGYSFICNGTVSDPSQPCAVQKPFGGGPWQYGFDTIMGIVDSGSAGQVYYNTTTQAKYVTIKEGGKKRQMWFDDEETLAYKYRLASKYNLRGVGIFTADLLNYTSGAHVRSMWNTIKNFTTAAV